MNKLKQIKPSDLIAYKYNARKHSEKQIEQVAKSITEFGFLNPVIIDKSNGIIAGHCRVSAAIKLEMSAVPCLCVDHLTAKQKRAYILADNKLALNSTWDDGLLADELKALKEMEFDFDIIGFDNIMLETPEFTPDLPDENETSNTEKKLQLLVSFESEDEQQMLFDELNTRGYKVKV